MYNQRFFEFPHWVEPWEVQSPRHYFPVYQTPKILSLSPSLQSGVLDLDHGFVNFAGYKRDEFAVKLVYATGETIVHHSAAAAARVPPGILKAT